MSELLDTLSAAIVEAEGGPSTSEDDEARYMAADILDTPSGRDIETELRHGRHAAAALRLVVMRHHADAAEVAACDVCAPAIAGLGK